MNKDSLSDSAITLLHEVISLWPDANNCSIELYKEALAPYLSSTFSVIDLINGIESIDAVADVKQSNRYVQIEFTDTGGCLHRAIFSSNQAGDLKLESLEMQCPVCFGTGVNDSIECLICGGNGWGVS